MVKRNFYKKERTGVKGSSVRMMSDNTEDNADGGNIPLRSGGMSRFTAGLIRSRLLSRLDWQGMFAALQYRNYRLWFRGQLVSLMGTWMQTTAQGFLVFQLTHSTAYLGYVGFAAGVPSWLMMLFGGVIADRVPRRNLLLATQATMMVLAFILAILTFSHLVRPWHIILLAFGLGTANAFDAPARQSFVLEMVEREDLANAIALNASMFNLATVLGPAWCFTLNGTTFIAVIVALVKMRLKPFTARPRTTAPFDDFKEGVRYAASHEVIRTLLSVVAVMNLFGTAYMTLIPAWAVRVLGGNAATNGWLLSARGVGALGGALMIAALGRFKFKGRLLTLGSFIFPCMLLLFAVVRWLPLSLLALAMVGWGYLIMFNTCNILIQTLVSDELRGRVVSIFTLGFFALMPLGALLSGWTAEAIGEPMTVVLSAVISLSYAAWVFSKVPLVRLQE